MNNDLVIVSKSEIEALVDTNVTFAYQKREFFKLLNKAQVVNSEPVAMVGFDGIGEQQATAIKWLTEYFPKKGDMLFITPQPAIPEYAEIYVGDGLFAIVDWEDFDKVKGYKWSLTTLKTHTQYAQCWDRKCLKTRKKLIMHRVIMNDGREVDHINGNGLDNRKSNLRYVTHQQNMYNMKSSTGSSKYKGVSFEKSSGLWRAYLTHNGKRLYMGRFQLEIDAAVEYDRKARELFGNHAKCNFEKVDKAMLEASKKEG